MIYLDNPIQCFFIVKPIGGAYRKIFKGKNQSGLPGKFMMKQVIKQYFLNEVKSQIFGADLKAGSILSMHL
jgi:hypothetical protein